MTLNEVELIIDYFHSSTPEHLERLGVDPTRLPTREQWRSRLPGDYHKPVSERSTLQRVGFRYLKTHTTVPGPLNYHQAVTRWVFEK
jgi:hypothetical protein